MNPKHRSSKDEPRHPGAGVPEDVLFDMALWFLPESKDTTWTRPRLDETTRMIEGGKTGDLSEEEIESIPSFLYEISRHPRQAWCVPFLDAFDEYAARVGDTDLQRRLQHLRPVVQRAQNSSGELADDDTTTAPTTTPELMELIELLMRDPSEREALANELQRVASFSRTRQSELYRATLPHRFWTNAPGLRGYNSAHLPAMVLHHAAPSGDVNLIIERRETALDAAFDALIDLARQPVPEEDPAAGLSDVLVPLGVQAANTQVLDLFQRRFLELCTAASDPRAAAWQVRTLRDLAGLGRTRELSTVLATELGETPGPLTDALHLAALEGQSGGDADATRLPRPMAEPSAHAADVLAEYRENFEPAMAANVRRAMEDRLAAASESFEAESETAHLAALATRALVRASLTRGASANRGILNAIVHGFDTRWCANHGVGRNAARWLPDVLEPLLDFAPRNYTRWLQLRGWFAERVRRFDLQVRVAHRFAHVKDNFRRAWEQKLLDGVRRNPSKELPFAKHYFERCWSLGGSPSPFW